MSIPDQHGRAEELDRHLFNEGTHRYLHRRFGAQPADGGCFDFEHPTGSCFKVRLFGCFGHFWFFLSLVG